MIVLLRCHTHLHNHGIKHLINPYQMVTVCNNASNIDQIEKILSSINHVHFPSLKLKHSTSIEMI